jgi:amino acid transporter
LITAVTLGLGVLNGAGIRQTAWVINGLTAAKLTPLVVFVAVGVFHAEWGRLTPLPPVNWEQTAGAGLLLFFTFGGFDTVVVPAGEARDPRRDLPFALVVSIAVSTAVMMLVQAVTMATLADVAGSATPVADAAAGFLGTWGTAMVVAGSAVSMLGNNVGGALSASRVLFALGEQADLPAWFARIHPRFRTPWNSIWFSTAVALGLALAGSFAWLAATSALARLLTYLAVAAATLRFRRGDLVRVPEAAFRAPLGALVPVAAIASSCAMFVGATRVQLLAGLGALVVGAALYVLAGDGVRALRGSGRGK